jgi:AcrR family transcriptional regulator
MTTLRSRKPAKRPVAREPVEAGGRDRLIAAALRLAAEKRSLVALGVRELGRMAGLNPNTFYRHFKSLDELSVAVVDGFAEELLPTLRAMRLAALPREQIAQRTVEQVFDYAREHPEAFIVGVRELHGSSAVLKAAIRARIQQVARELSEDLLATQVVTGFSVQSLQSLAEPVVEHVFHHTLDYLSAPERRTELVRRMARFVEAAFIGAVVLHNQKRWD